MVTNLWAICYKWNIELSAHYLAGTENQRADYLACIHPQHEWKLHLAIFRILDGIWGMHTVDRLASIHNQVPTYNSWFWDPWSNGVSAPAQHNWREHNNFANCPFSMLPQVLDKNLPEWSICHDSSTVVTKKAMVSSAIRITIDSPWRLPKWTGKLCPEPLRNLHWHIYAWRVNGELYSVT